MNTPDRIAADPGIPDAEPWAEPRRCSWFVALRALVALFWGKSR